ncbi:hypothetical protein CAPTEDRAFT_225944 [Capitella teleta]|uniref:15-hydroxyprostaglandin dehydrogenase [NAD(+)] n=1 Tax=Capitella teleta TaxID=283909 RepID=R7TI20_CAPTE|nr:hypothetical protein CAPTEDRAFT_225944 [Capitella teleta]|eukprot:ELT91196.1 hypothetical protein CAPTEDRAFT_225944 [Capitella teleta]
MESKIAVVFGATGGIGLAVCNALHQRGCKVLLADILDEKEGTKVAFDAMESRDHLTWYYRKCDITKKDDIEDIFRFSQEKFGRHVEIVVNCAGILNELDWQLCVQVNIVGPILITKCSIEHMSKAKGGRGGCVVHFSSILGMTAGEYCPTYCATKHAVIGLSRSYGTENHFEQHGVRINCVCPAAVDTDMLSDKAAQKTLFPEGVAAMFHLLKKITPDQVASVAMDLIANDEMNGQAMMISHSRGVEQVEFIQTPFC